MPFGCGSDAFNYAPSLRAQQGPWLLLLNIPLFLAVMVKGQWSPLLRRLEIALGLATGAAMLLTMAGGPIVLGAAGDRTIKFAIVLITIVSLSDIGIKLYRRVRPAPDRQTRAWQ